MLDALVSLRQLSRTLRLSSAIARGRWLVAPLRTERRSLTRGRDRFSAEEIAWSRAQLAAPRRAERDEQKRIRAGLRHRRFSHRRLGDGRIGLHRV